MAHAGTLDIARPLMGWLRAAAHRTGGEPALVAVLSGLTVDPARMPFASRAVTSSGARSGEPYWAGDRPRAAARW